jgi:predicted kinase
LVTAARKVILAIGLPGAGKSTYFARRQIVPLSSDLIRQLLYDDAADQRRPDWVFTALRELLRRRLLSGARTSYIDATNLTRRNRRGFLEIARESGCVAEALFFDVPLEVCLERNRNRAQDEIPQASSDGVPAGAEANAAAGAGEHSVVLDLRRRGLRKAGLRKGRVVPEEVLRRMAQELEPPTLEEGFARILVVRFRPGAEERAKYRLGPQKSHGGSDEK